MPVSQPRHAASRPRALLVAVPIGLLFTAASCLGVLSSTPKHDSSAPPVPAAAAQLPSVDLGQKIAADPCAEDAVTKALADGDDAGIVAAFGGGEAFRDAVSAGNAPCVSLANPKRIWVVVNKARPLAPSDYAPASLQQNTLQTTTPSGRMRPEVAEALSRLAAEAKADGAGVIGVNNGYRSYGLQQTTYASHVDAHGQKAADAGSARPGHSEHQTGLAVDVIACGDEGCSGLDAFGATPQGRWVAKNAWRFGFVVRYEEGQTRSTGYLAEPWHLRYIGEDLAAAYHEGGYQCLEEFFSLPHAPDYTG